MREINPEQWDNDTVFCRMGVPSHAYTVSGKESPELTRIYVDDVDVTDRASEAHPVQGWVRVYATDADGRDGKPVQVILVGQVKIKEPEPCTK